MSGLPKAPTLQDAAATDTATQEAEATHRRGAGAGTLAACGQLLKRDLLLGARRKGELLHPLLFFIIAISLFPLALGPEPETLARLAPGVVWVAALLAALLSLEGLFRSDFEDGSLELMLLSPHPLPALVAARALGHWLLTGLPLLLIAAPLSAMLALPSGAIPTLLASLALGTPVLSLVGAIGVALTVGLRQGGALLALLVLPLYIPVLIFGASAVGAAADALPATGQLLILGALCALSLSLAPFAAAAALRVGVN